MLSSYVCYTISIYHTGSPHCDPHIALYKNMHFIGHARWIMLTALLFSVLSLGRHSSSSLLQLSPSWGKNESSSGSLTLCTTLLRKSCPLNLFAVNKVNATPNQSQLCFFDPTEKQDLHQINNFDSCKDRMSVCTVYPDPASVYLTLL